MSVMIGAVDHQRWYAVRAKSRQEDVAVVNLTRQGFEVYYPRIQRPPSPKAKRSPKFALGPLFPGYVFVAMDVGKERWQAVDSTYGVLHLVRFGDRPSPLPDGLVERMQERSDSHGLVSALPSLSVGENVRVIGGPFDGWIGQVQSLADSQQRIVLLVDLMSRATTLAIPSNNLVAA